MPIKSLALSVTPINLLFPLKEMFSKTPRADKGYQKKQRAFLLHSKEDYISSLCPKKSMNFKLIILVNAQYIQNGIDGWNSRKFSHHHIDMVLDGGKRTLLQYIKVYVTVNALPSYPPANFTASIAAGNYLQN